MLELDVDLPDEDALLSIFWIPGRDRITVVVACPGANGGRWDAEPSGFFVAFSWHSGQAGFGLPAFDCLMTKTSLTAPLALR